jgi:diguanylate cyclase (GGDEF)-like protein
MSPPSMESKPPSEESPPTTEFTVPVALRNHSSQPTGRKVPVLFVLAGLDAGRLFVLDRPSVVIGREKGVEVQLADGAMSRKHAAIHREGEQFFIQDLESRNGTFVNGDRIVRRALSTGDHVAVSPNVTLRFSYLDESEAALAKQLFDASTRDPLTHVFNRKYLMERVSAEVSYGLRHGGHFGTIMFDIDFFKQVNDTYGHAAGDAVLVAVAQRVARLVRAEDIVARYGGEEFSVAVRGVAAAGMRSLAERIRTAIQELRVETRSLEGTAVTLQVTVSIGLAMLHECPARTPTGTVADTLLGMTDRRLYAAKNGGRNRVVFEGA